MQSILIVDDDRDLLRALSEGLLGSFRVETCSDPKQAVDRLRSMSELAVVVADMRMPGMSGLELLQHARSIVPSASRVMLTSADDAQTAIAAINEGNVCRFLTKPCSLRVLEAAIWEALDLRQTLHQLLEAQFRMVAGVVEVLGKVIQMVDPESHALAQRLRQRMREIALEMIHPEFWELEVAAMLAPLGAVGARPVISSSDPLAAFSGDFPQAAAALLRQVPRMEKIAGTLAYLGKNFDGSGQPQDRVAGTQIPLGARMLRVVRDMEERVGRGLTAGDALRLMQTAEGVYDPSVLAAALACFGEDSNAHLPDSTPVAWTALQDGDTLADDIPSETGALLLTKGCRVTPNLKKMLQQMACGGRMPETVRIKTARRGGIPAENMPGTEGSG
jgi:response regulator RpfG family c-di-GMP phosphodiesterase